MVDFIASKFDRSKITVLDLETTGLNTVTDKILQISMIDGYGSTLFSSYIKPGKRKRWPNAQRVNHISYSMVKDAPLIEDVFDEIQGILNDTSLVVGFNVQFDINFLTEAGFKVPITVYDVMKEFKSRHFLSSYNLSACADYYGISFGAHDANEDTYATLQIFDKLIKKEKPENPVKSHNVLKRPIRTRKRKPLFWGIILFVLAGSYYSYYESFKVIDGIEAYLPFFNDLAFYMMIAGLILIIIGIIRRIRIFIHRKKGMNS